jgi:hypothetical protein
MYTPWKRPAAIAFAVCGFSILSLLGGCKTDVEKADEAVRADMNTATQELEKGGANAAGSAVTALQKATATKGASPASQIESNRLLAQSQFDAAEALINSADGIASRQVRIARLIGDMDTLASEINGNNVYVAGYRGLEPTVGLKAIEQASAAAEKGDQSGAWFAGPPPLPSQAALKQKQADLQKQLDQLNTEISTLTAQRTESLKQVEAFSQQADSTTGKSSVGFYIQASNQRKEAADDDTKIQQLKEQLVPLQHDLAVAQAQQKAVDAALAGYAEQQQKLSEGWKTIQQEIDTAAGFSKSLLDGSGAPAPTSGAGVPPAGSTGAEAAAAPTTATSDEAARSLTAMGTELDQQLQQVQELRKKAIGLLNDSFQHYDTALNLAIKYIADLNKQARTPDLAKLPERHAWQMLIDINQPSSFKLRQAAVESQMARLYADQYAELAQRGRLANLLGPALKSSGLAAPPALATLGSAGGKASPEIDDQVKKVEADIKQGTPSFRQDADALAEHGAGQTSTAAQQAIAGAQANLAYVWALTLLSDVTENPGQGEMAPLLKNMGSAQQMSDNYGWAQFALLQGNPQDYNNRLKAAISARDAVAGDNARYLLPSVLPPGLEFAVKTGPSSTTAPANSQSGLPGIPPSAETQPTTTEPAPASGGGSTPTTEPSATQPADQTTPATAPAQPATTPAQ